MEKTWWLNWVNKGVDNFIADTKGMTKLAIVKKNGACTIWLHLIGDYHKEIAKNINLKEWRVLEKVSVTKKMTKQTSKQFLFSLINVTNEEWWKEQRTLSYDIHLQ